MHNPPHPGAVLRGLYLEPLGLTVTRLVRAFSNTADGWLNMQTQFDFWQESRRLGKLRVQVLQPAGNAKRSVRASA